MPPSRPPSKKAPTRGSAKRSSTPTGSGRGPAKAGASPYKGPAKGPYKGPAKTTSRAPLKAAAKPRAKPAPKPKPSLEPLQAAPLTSSQRRYLRGLCHDLKPVIMLGSKGLTPAVHKELALALDHHELVKIKLSGGDRDERQQQIDELLEQSGAEMVQQIGHVASIFRRNTEEPKLALPR